MKTSDLIGDALDYAVDIARGFTFQMGIPDSETAVDPECRKGLWRHAPGGRWQCKRQWGHAFYRCAYCAIPRPT